MQSFSVNFREPSQNEFSVWAQKFLPGSSTLIADGINVHAGILSVEDSTTGATGSSWSAPEFIFKSGAGKQLLIVMLQAPQDSNGLVLYSIDHITCARGELIKQVHHRIAPWPPNSGRHPLTTCAPGTIGIVIEFKMPTTETTWPFKFSVYVRKNDSQEVHDADPQAGNDPPG